MLHAIFYKFTVNTFNVYTGWLKRSRVIEDNIQQLFYFSSPKVINTSPL